MNQTCLYFRTIWPRQCLQILEINIYSKTSKIYLNHRQSNKLDMIVSSWLYIFYLLVWWTQIFLLQLNLDLNKYHKLLDLYNINCSKVFSHLLGTKHLHHIQIQKQLIVLDVYQINDSLIVYLLLQVQDSIFIAV